MTKIKILSMFLTLVALIGLSSCEDDDNSLGNAITGPGTVYNIVSKNNGLTKLDSAMIKASGNIPDVLNGQGPFTILAPTNAAFEAFAKAAGFEKFTDLYTAASSDLLAQILTYHVIPQKLAAGDFSDGDVLTTVKGDDLTVVINDDGDVQFTDATKLPETNPVSTVSQANSYADNGILHFIDRVLIPEEAITALNIDVSPTILEWATGTDDLSSLAAAVVKAELADAIAGLDTARVLAPNNAAFTDLFGILGSDYSSLDDFDNDYEINLLGNILLYHVLPVEGGSIDLMAGPRTTLLEDNTIDVIAAMGGFAFGDATATEANIVTMDIDARNGAVDIIDKVLLPQAALDFLDLLASDDMASVVVGTPDLSILEEALIATDLVDVFVDNTNTSEDSGTNFTYFRPATVFAPTDAAFNELFNLLGPDYTSIASFDTEEELALLSQILLYHVVPGNLTSDKLEAGLLTTAAERDLEIISVVGSDPAAFVVGDEAGDVNANITAADNLARNGVAHIIDKVLLPKAAIDFIEAMNP